jgi:hypothetical protein
LAPAGPPSSSSRRGKDGRAGGPVPGDDAARRGRARGRGRSRARGRRRRPRHGRRCDSSSCRRCCRRRHHVGRRGRVVRPSPAHAGVVVVLGRVQVRGRLRLLAGPGLPAPVRGRVRVVVGPVRGRLPLRMLLLRLLLLRGRDNRPRRQPLLLVRLLPVRGRLAQRRALHRGLERRRRRRRRRGRGLPGPDPTSSASRRGRGRRPRRPAVLVGRGHSLLGTPRAGGRRAVVRVVVRSSTSSSAGASSAPASAAPRRLLGRIRRRRSVLLLRRHGDAVGLRDAARRGAGVRG